ncbi:facilitated trehalose transporter Tret1-2 homolog isoform X2 [Cephus cinctus]|uniref:Facilitated trehalose transporter Tret1-2 homolog isoform X2 n=1 Tax=Cephus cinctus TaxID=211228 RepID=A0AAJ7C6Z1_CEPCN|nr:facilitated trehalose transporter Tret1-2 homolog isoform X2 [Cephus cinctus]
MGTKEASSSEKHDKEKRTCRNYQIVMCIIANCSVLGPAMGLGYSAVALPSLTSPQSQIKINESQASWIASIAAIGTPIGCILSSFLMRRGRKPSILSTSVVSLSGWIIIYLSANFEQLLIGRLLSGIATGLASVPATVYAAEVSVPKLRSIVVTWTSIAIAVGILIVYILGYIFQDNWRMIALVSGLFPILAIILTVGILPESPIWLRDRGRNDEALEILKKFRGIPADTTAPQKLLDELRIKNSPKKKNLLRSLLRRSSIQPFAIMLCYFFFQQFSGIFVIVFYAVDIARNAGIKIDAYLAAILIGFTRLIGTFLICYISRKFGRRPPSIASGAGMTLVMGILSLYLFLNSRNYVIGDGGLIPVVCILMLIFSSTLGFLVLPFAMIGEIYPTKVKDVLSGLTTCIAYIFSFISIKTYPDMQHLMGEHGVFLFYCIMSLIGTIFVLIFLPETKGKTLQEIEELFIRKSKISKNDVIEKEKMIEPKEIVTIS